MDHSFLAIVLAAGEGTRMRSSLPKVLHNVAGLPMIGHVVRACLAAGASRIALVTGNQAEQVQRSVETLQDKHCAFEMDVFVQGERLGTAHATLAARQALEKKNDYVIVCYGDTPLVTPQLFQSIQNTLAEGADVAVLGFETQTPFGYGRLLTEGDQLVAIREEKDASETERSITFCNSGIMGFKGTIALSLLESIDNKNVKAEYYLTDAVEIAHARGMNVRAVIGEEADTLGVNNRSELANAESLYQARLRTAHMTAGVSLIDPNSIYFAYDTVVGTDCIIEPNCYFAPGVEIGNNVHVKANSYFEGDLKKGQLVKVDNGAVIGPFARLRPGAHIGIEAKVGNFCEVKNADIAKGAKVNHLTYIGDATVGANANIGAGTITCNYDGFDKFHTNIGAGAFVGSNSSLVAPVTIKDGAYIGSGSVITENVSSDSLAIARGRQVEKENWAKNFRTKKQDL